MATQSNVVGTVRLARDARRLLTLPVLAILFGLAGAGASRLIQDPLGIAVAVAGLLVAGVGLYLAAWLLSFRLEVGAGTLNVRWLGGQRRYQLVRGQLTRVVTRGPGAAALRPRLGILGLGLGPAVLRGEEHVELLRLASSDSMILVPTDRGRLAISAAVEQELLDALVAAVLRQQELDLQKRAAGATTVPPPLAHAAAASPTVPEVKPARIMTGIERALLEERLAAERAAALATAEAERRRAAPAGMAASTPASSEVARAPKAAAPTRSPRERARSQWQRPGWLALPAWITRSTRLLDALPIVAPLLVAAAAWIVAIAEGRISGPFPEARYLIMALALTGPVAAFAVFVARSWQPRLTGLVSWSALAAQVLLARALIGKGRLTRQRSRCHDPPHQSKSERP